MGGQSQYYVEPKRLARLGYLVARKEPGKTRQRTVYELTDKGREALVAWARTPVHFQPFKSELLLRRDGHGPRRRGRRRDSVGTLRADIADLRTRLDEGVASAELLPHRRKYLLMVNDRLRELLDLHLRWVDEIERELQPAARSAQRQPYEPTSAASCASGGTSQRSAMSRVKSANAAIVGSGLPCPSASEATCTKLTPSARQ